MPKKIKESNIEELYFFVEKYSLFFIIGGFILVNIFFNYNIFWSELISDRSTIGQVHGEVEASEYGLETVYRNIISFRNPFSPFKTILHPFELDVIASDTGLGFNMIFFRPYLSLHQAVSMIVVFNLFFSNVAMYLLLRKLKNAKAVSFIIALAYGFMTFLTVRLGHIDYTTLYLFPFFYYFVVIFFGTRKRNIKIFSAISAFFFLVLSLWQNIYYFTMIIVSCIFFVVYYFLKYKLRILKIIKDNIVYIVPGLVFSIVLLSPWLYELRNILIFSETPEASGWGGAVEFSADLFGVLIPSQYNYYYGGLVASVIKDIEFAKDIFENFTYPGIIIFVTGFFFLIFYKRIPRNLKEAVHPSFIAAILFFILTLGPFLHIFGRWALLLEGVAVVFPLPFVLLHYIPFIGNIRSPGRFSVAMIFFAYVFVAYLLTYWLKDKSKKIKVIFLIILLVIFLIDHRYIDTDFPKGRYIPNKIYEKIATDKDFFSVLRIPFTVRDGYTYFGDYNAILVNEGQLIYNKPVIGGYSGRIANYIKTYYQQDPFVGYIGRFIDVDSSINLSIDNSQIDNWKVIDVEESKRSLDFLSIKYIILHEDSIKSKDIKPIINKLGFKQILTDNMFTLWTREPNNAEYLVMNIEKPDHTRLLGHGWYAKEGNFRWAHKESSSIFKIRQPRNMTLNLRVASFANNQTLTIYVNKKKLKEIMVKTDMNIYSVKVPKEYLEAGINHFYYIFDESYQPSEIIENNLDKRKLGGKFEKIIITD